MAISFVQKAAKFAASSAASATSASLTTTTNNLLVLTCSSWCSNQPYTLTPSDSKTNTWGAGDRINVATSHGNGRTHASGAVAVSAGASHTGTITSNDAATYFEGTWSEYTGNETSSITDVSATNTSGDGSTTVTVTTATTTQADTLSIAVIALDGSEGTITFVSSNPPTGFTAIQANLSNATIGMQSSYRVDTGTGAKSVTWTWTGNAAAGGSAAGLIVFKASGGGGGGPTLITRKSLMGVGI